MVALRMLVSRGDNQGCGAGSEPLRGYRREMRWNPSRRSGWHGFSVPHGAALPRHCIPVVCLPGQRHTAGNAWYTITIRESRL